ncbi:Serine/threonine-protein kinase RIO2 [Sarcoptes scabiei]|nr:Serine/threonine-protein kinase RIO2 [Sarcoptes scabiei]
MVKLDVTLLRYLKQDDFRVLTAIEMGQKNHELVPKSLVYAISKIQNGSIAKILTNLAQNKLISYERGKRYDGYRLTYRGYDYLALNVLRIRGVIASIGNQIGVGKESDIYIAKNEDGRQLVIKFHRLGRTCFRNVSQKRDYQKKNHNHHFSWIYLSRLAAMREFAFMKLLYERGSIPVPEPIDVNRHCIVMELIDGRLLNNITADDLCQDNEKEEKESVSKLYDKLMAILERLANEFGVVHGDFNEFNILIKLHHLNDPVLIDFPQMISIDHQKANEYFDRDVECIVNFFAKRFHYESDFIPIFEPFKATDELKNLADATIINELQTTVHNELDESQCKDTDYARNRIFDEKNEILNKFFESLPSSRINLNTNDKHSSGQLITKSDGYQIVVGSDNQHNCVEENLNNLSINDDFELKKGISTDLKCYDFSSSYNKIDHGLQQTIRSEENLDDQVQLVQDHRTLNDDEKDVCSVTSVSICDVNAIRKKLIKEKRKTLLKNQLRINPKGLKGDVNALRRKKKDDHQIVKEDFNAFKNDSLF